ncbi:aliphatic sulfonate ABC transporter substrate-binding protein [Litchfieldia salsa]|uniref:NitT/TauT family transport system substrate-binding protein n=1 Tax=Litchfieldia salsa TaxID=930152 RepID=A0A1H0S1X2_9BACI|nr:aliphatic sulfonate ABC transporter substrate-binding protein [Litchfieldia salsa]SDP35704.1 NitT/TauT family transport system substrate-binding protein [Litchfieldia salsa]
MKKKIGLLSILLLLVTGILAACGGGDELASSDAKKVVIGYFPNIDHAPAMVAREKGYFQNELGENVEIEYLTFPDGGAFMTALKTGEIHAGLVGPGPVMNNYTNGADVKIIAGASSGGTHIVARADSGIETIEDIAGKTFITPGVGCTHDVQMETLLKEYGITSARIGGSLKHLTGNPAQYAGMFESGKVDLAAVPEPWASQLVKDVGAKIIVDSNEISFGETLPNTILVTSNKAIEEDKDLIQSIVKAHNQAVAFINDNKEESIQITIDSIKETTKQDLDKEVVDMAWEKIRYTTDVDAEVIQQFANSSHDLKFLKEKPDFANLIDLQFIETVTASAE